MGNSEQPIQKVHQSKVWVLCEVFGAAQFDPCHMLSQKLRSKLCRPSESYHREATHTGVRTVCAQMCSDCDGLGMYLLFGMFLRSDFTNLFVSLLPLPRSVPCAAPRRRLHAH